MKPVYPAAGASDGSPLNKPVAGPISLSSGSVLGIQGIMRLSYLDVLTIVGVALLLAAVFYFSWLPQPRLGTQVPMPGFLARWVDARVNENFRTAVPFFMIGLLAGANLAHKRAAWRAWTGTWTFMILTACIAELGQCFIPARTCDPRDIGWAAAGGAAGLLLATLAGKIPARWRMGTRS